MNAVVLAERIGLGSSLMCLLSMVAVFGWFWFMSRPAQIQRVAESRRGKRWLNRGRSYDEDVEYLRRMSRYVMLPAGAAGVVLAICVVIRELVFG